MLIYNDKIIHKIAKLFGEYSEFQKIDDYKEQLSSVKPFDFNVTLSDETRFYLSDKDLVICAGVIHAIGDYFEVKINYPKLKPFLKSIIR